LSEVEAGTAGAPTANERLIESAVRLPAIQTPKRPKTHQRLFDATAAGEADL
jgi:hypothetical protein